MNEPGLWLALGRALADCLAWAGLLSIDLATAVLAQTPPFAPQYFPNARGTTEISTLTQAIDELIRSGTWTLAADIFMSFCGCCLICLHVIDQARPGPSILALTTLDFEVVAVVLKDQEDRKGE